MTGTHIRIGQIAIDGLAHAPSEAVLQRQLQAEIGQALGRSTRAFGMPLALPQVRITLPHGASEGDIAAAVARALRDMLAGSR